MKLSITRGESVVKNCEQVVLDWPVKIGISTAFLASSGFNPGHWHHFFLKQLTECLIFNFSPVQHPAIDGSLHLEPDRQFNRALPHQLTG
jgi:hypothetical protein